MRLPKLVWLATPDTCNVLPKILTSTLNMEAVCCLRNVCIYVRVQTALQLATLTPVPSLLWEHRIWCCLKITLLLSSQTACSNSCFWRWTGVRKKMGAEMGKNSWLSTLLLDEHVTSYQYNNNSINSIIYVLHQQLKGQLQSQHNKYNT
jgi:hypothetical protein